jgi:alkylation response protein AidB-like acyl-CoA dehydrogenase
MTLAFLSLIDTEDMALLRAACRRFLEAEMPVALVRQGLDREGKPPDHWSKISELGWPGVGVPEPLGGLGLGAVELTVLAQESGRFVQPGPLLASAVFAASVAQTFDSDEARETATQAAAGKRIGTWSVDCQSDLGTLRLRPHDHSFTLSGTRRLVPAADLASDLLIDVDCDGEPALVLAPMPDIPGRVRRMSTLDVARDYGEVRFDGVPIEGWRVLRGAPGHVARQRLANLGTVLQCAESSGAATRLLELTVAYAVSRQQFGRAIGSFQAIKHRLADMRIRTKSSDVAVRYAAHAVATDQDDATAAVHTAKCWVGESASWVAGEAQQIHGATGFTWDSDLHLFLRRIKANELTMGTPAWHAQHLAALSVPHP